MGDWHLLGTFVLTIAALLIADYLTQQWMIRQQRRKRLEARLDEIKRAAWQESRLRELRRDNRRPTLNTRGKAP